MKEIRLKAWAGRDKTKVFQAVLLDNKYAIFSRMGIVQMVAVEPAEEQGIYQPLQSKDNHLFFIGTGGRTYSSLVKYAKRIMEMSAFELLTKHYDPVDEVFFILSKKKPNF
ncbi:hypothetical protein [Brevibacillus agri]|uniref:hypothetical protein n=1 Tax=Brevibacillus agri TaxID=51101 RepID=UPI003D1DDF7C